MIGSAGRTHYAPGVYFGQGVWRVIRRPAKKLWSVLWLALCKYADTDGEQRAASFAYYAFFALFPLILLFISIGSIFVDQVRATSTIMDFVSRFIPAAIGEDNVIEHTIAGVMKNRSGAGVIAFLGLAWSSLRFFQALVHGVNRAWGTTEYSWWRLPLKNLAMVGVVASALLLGVITPMILDYVEYYYWTRNYVYHFVLMVRIFYLGRLVLPPLVLFYGFTMFYKFAPRRRTTFKEVWIAALLATILLQILRALFVLYVRNFANFNALYGTFGGMVAILMWIYLSGSIIILGGCLSAAQAEIEGKKMPTDKALPEPPKKP